MDFIIELLLNKEYTNIIIIIDYLGKGVILKAIIDIIVKIVVVIAELEQWNEAQRSLFPVL
jgi:hypothetical protein